IAARRTLLLVAAANPTDHSADSADPPNSANSANPTNSPDAADTANSANSANRTDSANSRAAANAAGRYSGASDSASTTSTANASNSAGRAHPSAKHRLILDARGLQLSRDFLRRLGTRFHCARAADDGFRSRAHDFLARGRSGRR